MYKGNKIKKLTEFLTVSSLLILFCVCCVRAQQNMGLDGSGTKNNTPVEGVKDADVLILANVTAKDLKFETVPNPKVEFPGKPDRQTVWEADRQNLPSSVEPGVTYRNIGIQLRIASRFADIERIVAEALGEIPLTDDAPKTQPPIEVSSVSALPKAASEKNKTQSLNRKNKPQR